MSQQKRETLPDIRHTTVIDAPILRVWAAVSTAESIAEWFMPNDFQPIVGHEFTLQSPYGPSPCKVLELDPPYRLSFAWDEFGWHVTFILRELEGKTEFTLIHSGWGEADAVIPKAEGKQFVIRDRMDKGWAGISERLRKVVEQG